MTCQNVQQKSQSAPKRILEILKFSNFQIKISRYGDWTRTFLNTTCGGPCAKIRVLPIFDLSLPRFDSHHGSFGRGRFDDKATDCRHFCNNVVDVWNTVFFNMLCS